MSYGDLEAAAAHVRHRLQIEPSAALPAQSLFERLDEYQVRVSGRDVPLTYAVEVQQREGSTYYDPKLDSIVVTLSEATYEGLGAGVPRDIFTFSHELGHAICHASLLLKLPFIPHDKVALMRDSRSHPKYLDVEWQANGFAAALLAPAEALVALENSRTLSPRRLEASFNMSAQSAAYRVDNFQKYRRDMVAGSARGRK